MQIVLSYFFVTFATNNILIVQLKFEGDYWHHSIRNFNNLTSFYELLLFLNALNFPKYFLEQKSLETIVFWLCLTGDSLFNCVLS